jgi:CDP-diacylglycerol--glycerol-3-phosphate 3-phosphatidyltransferase
VNVSTKLTLARLFATPILVVCLGLDFPGNYPLALVVFLGAVITDYLDGHLARTRGETTDFGALLDPLADKILISAAFISFIGIEAVSLPAWMVIVIVSREFAITGLRLLAAGKGEILPAGLWGKHKTVSQMAAVVLILLYLCLGSNTPARAEAWRPLLLALVSITVVLTISSGLIYIVSHRRLFSRPPDSPGAGSSGPA